MRNFLLLMGLPLGPSYGRLLTKGCVCEEQSIISTLYPEMIWSLLSEDYKQFA